MVQREWERWPGNNRFCLQGRLMTGPISDCGPNAAVWCLILVPISLHFYYICPTLWKTTPIMVFMVVIAFLWTITSLLVTGFSDPGIIPRQTVEKALEEAQQYSSTFLSEPPKSIRVNNILKLYCRTCHIYRPPRASHCSLCNNCVKVFDHHCPFVGNCIGERNYGAFSAFLLSVLALLMSVLMSMMAANEGNGEWNVNVFVVLGVGGYSLVMCFILSGFSLFHAGLTATGKTTNELIKGRIGDQENRINCCNRSPSLLNPRAIVKMDSIHSDIV